MCTKNNVFIVTRPLQYLNIKGIVEKDSSFDNELVIIPNFTDVENFKKNILKCDKYWHKVLIIDSRIDLLLYVVKTKINNLYINSDLAFNYLITLFSNSNKTYVYEEGWGTYNLNISNGNNRLKSKFYNLIGSGKSMGHSYFTDGIYVYNKELYQSIFLNCKKKIIQIEKDFFNTISSQTNFFNSVYNYRTEIKGIHNKNVLIYATGWSFNERVLDNIDNTKNTNDVVLVKLHPHIKNCFNDKYDYQFLSQNVLLEMYITDLIFQNNNITVYHDNSFSVLYFLDKIKAVNIGRERVEYNQIFNSFKIENK